MGNLLQLQQLWGVGGFVVVSGRVLAAGDLAAVTSRMVAGCYREGDADIGLHFERTIARVNHT